MYSHSAGCPGQGTRWGEEGKWSNTTHQCLSPRQSLHVGSLLSCTSEPGLLPHAPSHNRKKEEKKKKKKTTQNKTQTSFSADYFFFLTSFFIFFLSEVSDFGVVHSLNLVGSLAGVIQQSSVILVSKSMSQVVRRTAPAWDGERATW